MKGVFRIIGILCLFSGCATADELTSLEPRLMSVKRCVVAYPNRVEGDALAVAKREFQEALRNLAEGVSPELAATCKAREADSIDYALICIAIDFRHHADRVGELEDTYLRAPIPANSFERGDPPFPQVRKEHLKEEYRYAWQFLLMMPESFRASDRNFGGFLVSVVLPALREIDSPASHVIYEFCFLQGAAKLGNVASWSYPGHSLKALLDAMMTRVEAKSVMRVLRCLQALENRDSTYLHYAEYIKGRLLGASRDAVDILFKVRDRSASPRLQVWRKQRAEWKKAIAGIDAKQLSARSNELLQEVQGFPEF